MGQRIVYCDGCRTRLSGRDDAFRVGHQNFCAACAPPALPKRPPSDRAAQRVRPAPPAKPRPLALWIGLALAAVALVALVAVASKPARSAPPPAERQPFP
ncbi:MAG TPA: hypothetical protein VF950_27455 [Planctomycetota bacterium]